MSAQLSKFDSGVSGGHIPLAPELLVPLAPGLRVVAAGTSVRPGDPLVRDIVPGLPIPHAPAAGVVSGERTVRLTSGELVTAAVLQTTGYQHEVAPRVVTQPFTEQIRELLQATRRPAIQRPPTQSIAPPDSPPASSATQAKGTPATLPPLPASPTSIPLLPVGIATPHTLLASLFAAGVRADRPSCPDLARQLFIAGQPSPAEPVDTVICTTLDPDPHLGICADLATQSAPDIVIGALLGAVIANAKRILLVIEPTVPARTKRELSRLATQITRAASQHQVPLVCRAVAYANHYPRADLSLLMLRLLNRKLPPGALPTTRGALILDTPAAMAMGRSIRLGEPMTHVPIALADHRPVSPASNTARSNLRETSLHRVPIGTPLSYLVAQISLRATAPDTASTTDEARPTPSPTNSDPTPIEYRTNDILQERIARSDSILSHCDLYIHLLPSTRTTAPPVPPDPCIRCGWCVEACPTHAHPAALLEAAQKQDRAMADRANLRACIECGLCQYVCPSRLPILTAIRTFAHRHNASPLTPSSPDQTGGGGANR